MWNGENKQCAWNGTNGPPRATLWFVRLGATAADIVWKLGSDRSPQRQLRCETRNQSETLESVDDTHIWKWMLFNTQSAWRNVCRLSAVNVVIRCNTTFYLQGETHHQQAHVTLVMKCHQCWCSLSRGGGAKGRSYWTLLSPCFLILSLSDFINTKSSHTALLYIIHTSCHTFFTSYFKIYFK